MPCLAASKQLVLRCSGTPCLQPAGRLRPLPAYTRLVGAATATVIGFLLPQWQFR